MNILKLVLFATAIIWLVDTGLLTIRKNVGENVPTTWDEKILIVFLGVVSIPVVGFISNPTYLANFARAMTVAGLVLSLKVFLSSKNDKDRWAFVRYAFYSLITVFLGNLING